jgi:hypothetical protein
VVLALAIVFITSLAWGVARVARTAGDGTPSGPPAEPTRPTEERKGRFTTSRRRGRVASAPGT